MYLTVTVFLQLFNFLHVMQKPCSVESSGGHYIKKKKKKSVMHFVRELKSLVLLFTRIFLDFCENFQVTNACCSQDGLLMHPSLEWMKDHVYFSLVLAVCKACIAYHHTVVPHWKTYLCDLITSYSEKNSIVAT